MLVGASFCFIFKSHTKPFTFISENAESAGAFPTSALVAGEGAPPGAGAPEAPLLVAVGPEGGWSDFELRLFEEAGFRRLSLGPRILRTDTAVVALLALLAGGPRLARPENAWKTAGNVVE